MHCTVCGEEVGMLHDCKGLPAAVQTILEAPSPALRFAPLFYLREAIAIARLDDKAILRNSRDNNALLYGVLIWLVSLSPLWIQTLRVQRLSLPLLIASSIVGMPLLLIFQLGILGASHLAARYVFHGKGSYFGIVRVLLLGSLVQILTVIPVAGILIGSIWAVVIMMITFESVHRIRRTQAFAISFVIGLIVRLLGFI